MRVCSFLCIYIAVILFIHTIEIDSKVVSWNGGSGSFSDASKWSTYELPGPNDDVIIEAVDEIIYILVDYSTTVNSLNIGRIGKCTCFKTNLPTCSAVLIIQEPLRVTNGTYAYDYTKVLLSNTTLDSSIELQLAELYGSGTITGNVYAENSSIEPVSFNRTSSSSQLPSIDNLIGKLIINGNLTVSGATLTLDVTGNQPIVQMDALIVNQSIFDGLASTVRILFIQPMVSQYGVPYQLIFCDDISAYLYIKASQHPSYDISFVCYTGSAVTGQITGGNSDSDNYCRGEGFTILINPNYQPCCNLGWTGSDCSEPICPGEPDCSDHGICVAGQANTAVPRCECDEWFVGTSCAISTLCSEVNYCSKHGTCVGHNKCACDGGWTGANCSIAVCPGSPQCSGNGVCNIMSNTPLCDCNAGFGGDDCTVAQLGSCDRNCSGRGVCSSGLCNCVGNWTGSACHIPVCPGNGTNCNGVGDCVAVTSTVNVCECQSGWSGESCDTAICPGDCNKQGDCQVYGETPRCNCNYPYHGEDCSLNEIEETTSSKKGVSYGLIAGVTCGVVVATVAIIAVGFVMIRRKKVKRRNAFLAKMGTSGSETSSSMLAN